MIQPSSAQATSVIAAPIARAAVTKPPNTPSAFYGSGALLSVASTTD